MYLRNSSAVGIRAFCMLEDHSTSLPRRSTWTAAPPPSLAALLELGITSDIMLFGGRVCWGKKIKKKKKEKKSVAMLPCALLFYFAPIVNGLGRWPLKKRFFWGIIHPHTCRLCCARIILVPKCRSTLSVNIGELSNCRLIRKKSVRASTIELSQNVLTTTRLEEKKKKGKTTMAWYVFIYIHSLSL